MLEPLCSKLVFCFCPASVWPSTSQVQHLSGSTTAAILVRFGLMGARWAGGRCRAAAVTPEPRSAAAPGPTDDLISCSLTYRCCIAFPLKTERCRERSAPSQPHQQHPHGSTGTAWLCRQPRGASRWEPGEQDMTPGRALAPAQPSSEREGGLRAALCRPARRTSRVWEPSTALVLISLQETARSTLGCAQHLPITRQGAGGAPGSGCGLCGCDVGSGAAAHPVHTGVSRRVSGQGCSHTRTSKAKVSMGS